jgi:hypothetical protein
MQFQKKTTLALAALLALALPAAAAGPATWIHVAVDEGGAKANTVRVNLPLAVVEAVVPLMDQEWSKHAKIDAGDKPLKKADIKAMLAAVRDVEDAEFVRVDDDNENVRVANVKVNLVVHVREKGAKGDKDKVTIQVPMEVADALLSAPGDELDFSAALDVLKQKGHGPLVTVDDENSKVRIWLDDRNQAE